ncbi:MAG TPA: hypothetical protein H9695_11125 [Candidatus Mediterraneibacter excrementigallinarum]|nr:hypothetical protein [Candidatus Mediterraneibacter excrementigallinarum]
MKRDDEESSLPDILQRNPGRSVSFEGKSRSSGNLEGTDPMLRGMDGKQMKMASEQRTEL